MVKRHLNQIGNESANLSPRLFYYIKRIDYKTAMDIVVKEHYLHRRAPCSFAFGLFDKISDFIVGVICYGTPSSSSLRQGICGPEERFNVIELTRLWVSDMAGRCSESFLIGNTIRLVDKEIIVSYADTSKGHVGYVYQATNWIYTGLSAKRTNWTIEGVNKHCQSIADKHSAKELKELYGNKFSLQLRSRKHRYIYFNCSKKRKKELFEKLRYKVRPYPKE